MPNDMSDIAFMNFSVVTAMTPIMTNTSGFKI